MALYYSLKEISFGLHVLCLMVFLFYFDQGLKQNSLKNIA
jgi:hypothetical protein